MSTQRRLAASHFEASMLPPSPAKPEPTDLPLERYVALLRRCFTQRDCAPLIHAILQAHRPDRASLRAHLRWQPNTYTRNLLHREDRFELLVLCWDFAASSPVHDHGNQRCWTQVLSGALALETFGRLSPQHARHSRSAAAMAGPDDAYRLHSGDVDYRDLAAPAHRLSNTVGQRHRAVSLHLYARPVREFTVYNPHTGAAQRRTP